MLRVDALLDIHRLLSQQWKDVLHIHMGKQEARELREKLNLLLDKAEHEAPRARAASS